MRAGTVLLLILAFAVGVTIVVISIPPPLPVANGSTTGASQHITLLVGDSIYIDAHYALIYSGEIYASNNALGIFTVIYSPNSISVSGTCTYQLIVNSQTAIIKLGETSINVLSFNAREAVIQVAESK